MGAACILRYTFVAYGAVKLMEWILLGIPLGAVMLYLGSEWMVKGAEGLAIRLGVSSVAVGVTVVALGTSLPECVTSVVSGDAPQIIIGNIVGSNIANVGLALGLTAVAGTVAVDYRSVRMESLTLLFAVVLVSLLASDGHMGSWDGLILLACLAAFIFVSYHSRQGEHPENADEHVRMHAPALAALIAVGALFLYFGAEMFIDGSVCLADTLGVSEMVVGLIVVALGACLPETCISVVAALRGDTGLAAANILGSIIFNSFFALGVGALLTDIPIASSMMAFHIPVMLVSAVVMFLLLRFRDRITRPVGTVLVFSYLVYLLATGIVSGLAV